MCDQPLISVVDDDDGVRRSLDGFVRSLGYKVAMFDSAESYLCSSTAGATSCVISDIQMADGMSGIELARTLKLSGSEIPVILISAFLDDKVIELAREAGAYCSLKKPFSGTTLLDCLNKALATGTAPSSRR